MSSNAPRPMVSPVKGRVSSEYGRRAPIAGVTTGYLHAGIDIAAAVGTPVYAAWGGTVIGVGSGLAPGRSGDRNVLIQNPDGECQYYGHLNANRVRVGQKVEAGERIGDVGARGNVTGPHLHFETWANRSANSHRNPRIYFQFWNLKPGSTPKAGAGKPSTKPPVVTKPKGDAGTRTIQKHLNRYAKAGLVVDGIAGKVTLDWIAWTRALQRALPHWKGVPDLVVDGDYGSKTAAAVKVLQRRNGLFVDGVAGAKTVAFMRAHGSDVPNRPSNRP